MKHTPTQRELYEKERELLREKLEAWLRGDYHESRSAWIGMRVTPTIHELYRRAPDQVRLAARRAFESVIISWFLGTSVEFRQQDAPQVFNINININEANARAESKVQLSKGVLEGLRELEELLDFIAHRSSSQYYPRVIKEKARRGLETLRALFNSLN